MSDYRPVFGEAGTLIGFRLDIPRFRYFQENRGPMFAWTTERFEDLYASFVFVPVGKGSRSGKAEEWQVEEESISGHELRKDAKARALALFEAWESGEEKPW